MSGDPISERPGETVAAAVADPKPQPAAAHQELESIKARLREMEAQLSGVLQLKEENGEEVNNNHNGHYNAYVEARAPVDERSVYVGNVEYSSTAGDLEGLFSTCGAVRRVTIPLNSHDRHPKGFAYVEFDSYAAVEAAIALDDSLFKGRQIKVKPKRTNKPGMSANNKRPPRGNGGTTVRHRRIGGTVYYTYYYY